MRAGAAEALELFVAGDVVAARKRWAEAGAKLSLRPASKRGVPRVLTHQGRSLTLSQWARELGWAPQSLVYRVNVMPLEKALVPRVKGRKRPRTA